MRKFFQALLLGAMFVLPVSFAGCGGDTEDSPDSAAKQEQMDEQMPDTAPP